MRRSVFGKPDSNGAIRINPFFIETAIILPVFALCCCAVLRTLAVAAQRADNERTYAAAVACAESWCELFSASGSTELAAEELFGNDAAKANEDSMSFVIPCDRLFAYSPDNGTAAVYITESIEECKCNGLIYGQLITSDISLVWEGGRVEQSAVYYSPYSVSFADESEGAE